MEVDIFRDLKQLDERTLRAVELLDSSATLFNEHYSERFTSQKGSYSWPYSMEGRDSVIKWPDYTKEFPYSPFVSPLTNAMCGWSVGTLLRSASLGKQLESITTEAAARLSALPPERLRSSTFKDVDEIFVHAQVLRFLASQSQWKGAMFEKAFDKVLQAVATPNGIPHSFFLHYCVLALEQLRLPANQIAETVLTICKLADIILDPKTPKVAPSLKAGLEAFKIASSLRKSIETLETFVSINLPKADVLKRLAALSTRAVDLIDQTAKSIRANVERSVMRRPPSLKSLMTDCIREAGIILDILPSGLLRLTVDDQSAGWPNVDSQRLRTVANRVVTFDWYSEELHKTLKGTLQSQIAYAASADEARLDIGALAYSLAAGLRVDALHISNPLARKALSLIFEYQGDGRWRDVQPMSRTAQGFVHLPLNLEIANALLFVLSKNPDISISVSLQHIDNVMDWIVGTVTKAGKFQGWSSEHDYDPERIEFWVTAQVVQFLVGYQEMRTKLVTRAALERANITTVKPNAVPTIWRKLSATDLEQPYKKQVKRKIVENIALPFERTRTLVSSSVLLYGPPGTSKTSLMEGLANRLDWEFVQISPADFLSAGGDQVEARATLIFEILKRAKELVVLFDEVDEFLTDRGAEGRPGGIFRFMTTSMLPKLQSLRSRRTLVFAIATNYKEKLDKAITRLGRVDYDWAVLPPDFTSRLSLIYSFSPDIEDSKAVDIAVNTAFFSYLELRKVVSEGPITKLEPLEVVRHPTASPEAYNNRVDADDEFRELLSSQIEESLLARASEMTRRELSDQFNSVLKRQWAEDIHKKISEVLKKI